MRISIGGFQKQSFIDYPNKISAVIFLNGCNQRCPYCHNPDVVLETNSIPVNEIIDYLVNHKNFLDGVVVSGGEPTMQESVKDLCVQLKNIGYDIKLDTNGYNEHLIRRLIAEKVIDYIALDIKGYVYNKNLISYIMESGIDYEFRTTCAYPIITKEMIIAICKAIAGAKLYTLQMCVPCKSLDPDFFKKYPEQYGLNVLREFQKIALEHIDMCIIKNVFL